MMATDDATLNAGDKKNSTHKRNTREEIKRKLEVRDWTERRVHEKLISIGSFFFFIFKKEDLLLLFNLPPSAGVFERFISKRDIWMVRKSEGGGETKSI